MAIFGWNKKTTDAGGDKADAGQAQAPATQRDERKARAWFDRAATVADTRNYDYAIECYLNGLRFDPENMHHREAMYEVAKRRKVAQGKPAGLTERLIKSSGKDPISKLLDAEKIWAKDPLNPVAMLVVMKRAVEAHHADSGLDLGELIFWIGSMVLDANKTQKRPSKQVYVDACDLFSGIEAFGKAVDACKLALSLDDSDEGLLRRLRDLEAERTMKDAGYGKDFRTSVKDIDKQRELEMTDETGKSTSQADELVQRFRADFEENPEDLDRLNKLVKALENKETDEAEAEAMKLLRDAWDRTGQYRLQVRAGDIQIKQYNRQLRILKAAAEATPGDQALRKQHNDLVQQTLTFELNQYTERVKNYPTDLRLRFEMGRRLFLFHKFDEAIGAFQESQNDPKNRGPSQNYLGRCYLAKGWHDEATESFRKAIESYPIPDDRTALDMRYNLMDALEQAARRDKSVDRAKEARDVGSQILQININFRDIRPRVEKLRQLVDQLQSPAA